MESLLSVLLFAGLFFVMMRFGCGAHMMHGRRGPVSHKHGGQGADAGQATDPVCGMSVGADQGYIKMHAGQQHRFCSRNCLDKFEANPERYLTDARVTRNIA
jgi:YHS domain-containing protein